MSMSERSDLSSYWLRVLPRRKAIRLPKLISVQVVWGVKVRSGSLPLSLSGGIGMIYGCWMLREELGERMEKGRVSLSRSHRYVSSRRLKKGDPVGALWTLSNPADCRSLLHYRSEHTQVMVKDPNRLVQGYRMKSIEYWKPSPYLSDVSSHQTSQARVHVGVPRGNPRGFPHIRDHYDTYRPLGNPSQRTMNFVWKDLYIKDYAHTKKRLDLIFRNL